MSGRDYIPGAIGKQQNPEQWIRGGAIVDKTLSVQRLYVDEKSSIMTLTGKQSSDAPFLFNTGEPDVTRLYYTAGVNLYYFDVHLGVSVLIGNTGVVFFDIAISPTGEMYGIGDTGILYAIDLNTAVSTAIGQVGNINSLAFNDNGVLYALDGFNLVMIDHTNGDKAVIGDTGLYSMGDIVFFGNVLYLAATTGDLVRYPDHLGNLANREVLGNLGVQIYGLAQLKINDTNKLFGTSADFRICEINPETGVVSNFVSVGAQENEFFIAGATAQSWGKPLTKVADLYPKITVPDNTVCCIEIKLLGRDMVTNDVYCSSRILRVKNLDEFTILTGMAISSLGEGTLPVNDVILHYLADQSSFLIQVVSKSPNTVKWSATILKLE